MNRRTALKRAGALAVALGALEASGLSPSPHSAPVLPSSLRTSSFDISAFLAVPPQDYRTGAGFADQQVNGAGPARICTFAGTGAARLTTAAQGDYFDNGSIQHLSHVIPDMLQFFDMDDEMELPGEDGISASGRSPPRSRLLPRCPIC